MPSFGQGGLFLSKHARGPPTVKRWDGGGGFLIALDDRPQLPFDCGMTLKEQKKIQALQKQLAETRKTAAQPKMVPKKKRPKKPKPSIPMQMGSVVRTRLTRNGISDIKTLRLSWVAGYTWVGNGTSGSAFSVYFQTASSTWLIKGQGSGSSGQVPIAPSDPDVGQAYILDLEKHFTRKVIRRMWMHIDSLQPATTTNMMVVIGVSRGPGAAAFSIPITLATASVTANTVSNVASMAGSFVVDSWEHKTVDITRYIAGGSGAKQNEFDINAFNTGGVSIYASSGTAPLADLEGVVPACFAVAGNCISTAPEGTKVHQITIEQEVDLVDYIGGMANFNPLGSAREQSKSPCRHLRALSLIHI